MYTRLIKYMFYNTTELHKYSIKERFFLIGLVCFADDHGKFWYNKGKLKSEIFIRQNDASIKWIEETIDKFYGEGILCYYEDNGLEYFHFPQWFNRHWYLGQRLDSPRERVNPDCPICQTEKKKKKERENRLLNKMSRNDGEHSDKNENSEINDD